MDEYVDDSIVGTRFEAFLLGAFGILAFLLTTVGLYGVISYTVSQRTREMGIRLALGADRSAILAMVVKNGTLLAGAGVVIGLAAAFLLTRLMASLLFGVGPKDPITFSLRSGRIDHGRHCCQLHSSTPRGQSRSHGSLALRVR